MMIDFTVRVMEIVVYKNKDENDRMTMPLYTTRYIPTQLEAILDLELGLKEPQVYNRSRNS